jgi:hypothetical protein
LYFCTRKASKLRTWKKHDWRRTAQTGVSICTFVPEKQANCVPGRSTTGEEPLEQVSVFVLLYQKSKQTAYLEEARLVKNHAVRW